jgi:hypothetical protein
MIESVTFKKGERLVSSSVSGKGISPKWDCPRLETLNSTNNGFLP